MVAAICILPLSGCESIPEEHRGAAVGAGVGAATGTVGGAVLGKDTGSAVIGGLLGALVGGAIGHYAYDKDKERDETAQRYGYTPAKGKVIRVERAAVEPAVARPGETVNLNMTYAVLNPTPGATTEVTEVRTITAQNGELVGSPEVRVARTDGTYTSTIPITLPPSTAPGVYRITSKVTAPAGSDSAESTLTVRQ